jgi:hypothetical protein
VHLTVTPLQPYQSLANSTFLSQKKTATSNQPTLLFSYNKPAPATSQPKRPGMDTEPLCRDRRKTKGQRRQVFAAGVVVCACLVTRGPRASAAVRRAWSRGRVMPIAAAGLALWPFFFEKSSSGLMGLVLKQEGTCP